MFDAVLRCRESGIMASTGGCGVCGLVLYNQLTAQPSCGVCGLTLYN